MKYLLQSPLRQPIPTFQYTTLRSCRYPSSPAAGVHGTLNHSSNLNLPWFAISLRHTGQVPKIESRMFYSKWLAPGIWLSWIQTPPSAKFVFIVLVDCRWVGTFKWLPQFRNNELSKARNKLPTFSTRLLRCAAFLSLQSVLEYRDLILKLPLLPRISRHQI